MININSIVDELLSFEEEKVEPKLNLFDRVRNFSKRKEIEKQLKDEIDFENQRILKLGSDAEKFLNSSWYKELVEPHLRDTVKGGIQRLLREGDTMTEVQIKSEIACIKKALMLVAMIKLKVIRAKQLKNV